jgi:hypothetical protein
MQVNTIITSEESARIYSCVVSCSICSHRISAFLTLFVRAVQSTNVGINMFQRWTRKFGGGGPFSDPTAIVPLESLAEPGPGSLWQFHGKHCPRCQRTLARATVLERRAGRAAAILMVASAVVAAVKAQLNQKLTVPFAGLVLAVGLRCVERWAAQAHAKMHRVMTIDEIADVYTF